MSSELVRRPLLRWDEFTLHVDLDMLELVVNRLLEGRDLPIRRILIEGDDDALDLRVAVAWKGLPAQLSVRLSELRLHRRTFGCRVASLRGPLGLPLPIEAAVAVIRRFGRDLVSLDPRDRILLVDLRRFLPDGFEMRVKDVRCQGRWLELRLAGGSAAAALASPAVAQA
jgi:hypothetical protein